MGVTNRAAEILRLVRLRGSCRIIDLAEELNVSDETIRRNIRPLVRRGMVLKVHGGIMLPDRVEEPPFQNRMQENREAKQRIAALAARQVKDGDSIILDGGATTSYVALALNGHRDLQVVTNSTDIARSLVGNSGNSIFITGGELRADDAAAFGIRACEFVSRFQVRHAILSVGAINTWGFLDQHPCESEFAQAAMARAERVIVVADQSKFGRDGFVRICGMGDVDMLVSDREPPASLARALADADVEVLIAGDEAMPATA